ncbi:hypothetical protein [Pantoea sp.]|uniref:hypothetical protein n=1 Tax=Pantoea sp. TaxID=69393 RepID=UPI0028ABE37A|nr:hypothetical protein [Pantoea sp.]
MQGLVVIVICIAITILSYKKIANRCRDKGRGKFRTFLTATIVSFFIFAVTMGVGVANFFPKDPNSNIVDVPKVPMIKWTETKDMSLVHKLIAQDMKENPALTQEILKEISTYSEGSLDRGLAESNYIDYGVGNSKYMTAIENSDCRQQYKAQLAPYKAWRDAQDWRPFSEFPKEMRKQEMYRRDRVTNDYLNKAAEVGNVLNRCVFALISSLPHLSRPDAKPIFLPPYESEGLKCVRNNGGDYNACY